MTLTQVFWLVNDDDIFTLGKATIKLGGKVVHIKVPSKQATLNISKYLIILFLRKSHPIHLNCLP